MEAVIKSPRLPKKFNRAFWQKIIWMLRTGQLTSERLFGIDSDVKFNRIKKPMKTKQTLGVNL